MTRQHDYFSSHHQHFQWKMNFYHDGRVLFHLLLYTVFTLYWVVFAPRENTITKNFIIPNWWDLYLSIRLSWRGTGSGSCWLFPISPQHSRCSKPAGCVAEDIRRSLMIVWTVPNHKNHLSVYLSCHCCSKTMLNHEWNIGWFVMRWLNNQNFNILRFNMCDSIWSHLDQNCKEMKTINKQHDLIFQ